MLYPEDFKDMTRHSLLQKHIELLEELSDDGIMCVGFDEEDNKFYLVECCDVWFHHDLTKENCLGLSELFKEIAEVI